MIEVIINRKTHRVDVEPDTPLLWVIRDTLKLKRDRKFKPAVYMREGDDIAWDIELNKEQLEEAKKIVKKFK